MDNKNENSTMRDLILLWIACLFFGYAILNKAYVFLSVWLKRPEGKFIFIMICISVLTPVFYFLARKRERILKKRDQEKSVIAKTEDTVFSGFTDKNEEVFIKTKQRAMHTQVIGTTNAGKTESVILPWAIQDIEQGRGLILIDGKSDRSLLDKLWSYSVKHKRQKDFRLFSLSSLDESYQFNPLLGGSPEEVSERVFNSFEFENEYYRSVQFEVFSQVMRIFSESKEIPTFLKVFEAISTPNKLKALAEKTSNQSLKNWTKNYASLPASDLSQKISGLTAALSHFAFGKTASLFNTETPSIDLDNALKNNQIIYFQLPVLLSPFLGKATGKMILQCLQSAVANRHRGEDRKRKFYSVFLDDFSEYLYPGFVSILNKSRSANVGVVFAHQALGDIKTMGDAIANSILTNANLKIFMRGNDPESAEYFSKVIGTVKSVKYTARTKRGVLKQQDTGDASAREVDEFVIHPNRFKNELGVGQAVMVIPHEAGSRTISIKFQKFDDLPPEPFLKVEKIESKGLADLPESETPLNPYGGKNAA